MQISDIHINQYINEELSGEILTAFEEKLNNDKVFRQKVEMHKDIDALLMKNYLDLDEKERAKEKERLQPIFDEMGRKYFKKQNQPKTIIRRLWPFIALTAAASFLLLIFNPLTTEISPDNLADQYFEPYIQGSQMGEPNNDITNESPKLLLSKASEYYQNNQTEKAVQTFQKVANNCSEVYSQKANWYLALCYLKQNQPEKAKPLLENLKQDNDYENEAKAILKQLKF